MVLSHRRLVAIVAQDRAHWGCRELYEGFGCLVAVIRRALSALRQDDGIGHGVCSFQVKVLWVKSRALGTLTWRFPKSVEESVLAVIPPHLGQL